MSSIKEWTDKMQEYKQEKHELKCDLCGASGFTKKLHLDNAVFSSRIKEFDVLQCANCGLAVMSPFPTNEDVQEIYVKENVFSSDLGNPYKSSIFFKLLNPIYEKYANSRRYVSRKCLKLLRKKRDITVLDIGCSSGQMLNEFHKKNKSLDLFGIDLDPKARENASEFLKDKITIGNFLTHQFDKKFDIVTLSYVIEHVLDFKEYFKDCNYKCNKRG